MGRVGQAGGGRPSVRSADRRLRRRPGQPAAKRTGLTSGLCPQPLLVLDLQADSAALPPAANERMVEMLL